MPSISLVVPVYGVEKYIYQFLDSIHQQTFLDFEAILVDDGSKDNCPQILDEYASKDKRFHVIHQPNGGVSAARNTGLSYIKGKYVYIVDSDDWLEPTALESLWTEAERTDADLIYGDYIRETEKPTLAHCFEKPFVTEDIDTIRALQFATNMNGNKVIIRRPEFNSIDHFGGAPWRAMIKTSIIKDNNLRFDPTVRGLGDDILFTLHLYEYVHKVAYIQAPIYHYRVIETSYSHGFKANYLENMKLIFTRHEEFLIEYKKDGYMYKSYYLRVVIYLMQGMERYFKNSGNTKPERDRYEEFVQLIKTSPYREAIVKAPTRILTRKRLVASIFCLRLRMNRLFWRICI